jgi:hypothetical protein
MPLNPLRLLDGKRLLFRQRIPDFERVLIVESGSRNLLDKLLPILSQMYGDGPVIDIVTCFSGQPLGFRPDVGTVFRVGDYTDGKSRAKLYEELRTRQYNAIGIICSAEPIMTKWKWMLAAQIPAKLFVLNENGDYFWVDYTKWRLVLQFFAYRAGLTGSGAVMTPVRLLLLPFTFLYLLLYAAWVHLRRRRVPA